MNKRLPKDVRRTSILCAAANLVLNGDSYSKVRREDIGKAVGMSGPAVVHHFGSIGELRQALMRFAIRRKIHKIIVQGLIAEDPIALAAPIELREQAWAALRKSQRY